MFRRITISLLFILVSSSFVQPQTTSQVIADDAKQLWHNTGAFFGAPLRFNSADCIAAGAVIGGTVLLFLLDDEVRPLAFRNQSAVGGDLAYIGREYGRAVYGLSFAGGLYIGGLVFHENDVRETGLMLIESMAFANVLTQVLKVTTGRSRPYVGEGQYRFRGWQFRHETTALPSGHATVAFSVSSVLAARLKNTYASIGLYSLAALTAFSRIYDDEHWLSDVFLGAAIGTTAGLAVIRLHERATDDGNSFSLSFILGGLRAQLTF